jgi:hypothetical protein
MELRRLVLDRAWRWLPARTFHERCSPLPSSHLDGIGTVASPFHRKNSSMKSPPDTRVSWTSPFRASSSTQISSSSSMHVTHTILGRGQSAVRTGGRLSFLGGGRSATKTGERLELPRRQAERALTGGLTALYDTHLAGVCQDTRVGSGVQHSSGRSAAS